MATKRSSKSSAGAKKTTKRASTGTKKTTGARKKSGSTTRARQNTRLIRVELYYCHVPSGRVRRKVIDPQQVAIGGIVWQSGIDEAPDKSTAKQPPLPGGPGQPTSEECDPGRPDPTCCYWSGSGWICPDEWE